MAQGPAPLASALISEIPSWHYKAPERNQKGGFSGYIVRKPGDFDRIFFQATQQEGEPRCVAPFGISKPYDAAKEADSNKRNFELNVHSDKLREFIKALDENTVKQTIANYEAWLGGDGKKAKKPPSPEEIRSMYRPLLQEGDRDKNYSDMFRTKVNIKGDNILRVYVYEGVKNGRPVCRNGTLADITQFVEVVPIIEVVGMWFMSKQYGLSLATTDVVVFPKSKRPAGAFNFGGVMPEITAAKSGGGADDMDIVPTDEAAAAAGRGGTRSGEATGGDAAGDDNDETARDDDEEEEQEDETGGDE